MSKRPWQHHFLNLMGNGEEPFDDGDYRTALGIFQEAYRLIPDNKRDFGETTQAVGGMADCLFKLGEFERALMALDDVQLCPGGAGNPFFQLRRGQVLDALGRHGEARSQLTAAYPNGGVEVFEGDEEALLLIADVVKALPERPGGT